MSGIPEVHLYILEDIEFLDEDLADIRRVGGTILGLKLVFATGRGGAKICHPTQAPARVLAHNSRPTLRRWLIGGPAIEHRG